MPILAVDSPFFDIESKAGDDVHLQNTTVSTFAWRGINIKVKDRKTGQTKAVLENVDGLVRAGNDSTLSNRTY